MYESARERVLELCEDGVLLWEDVAFMSDADVAEMFRMNEIDLEDEEDE